MDLHTLGRVLIAGGLVLALIRVLLDLLGRIPFFGSLPGDVRFQTGNLTCFIPLGSMLVISITLTVLLNILARLIRR